MEYQTICESINTNYFGMINIAIALPYLKKSKGHLLLKFLYKRSCFLSIYSSAKAATTLCTRMGNFGIKVNCINPERTKTAMRIKIWNEPEASLLKPEMVALRSIQTLVSDTQRS
jgi:2-C-methyl-D-erythritol 4-phosphate cytidylyltransferase